MRKDWDQYFMDIAFKVKERSTCPRRQVGAVVVKDNRIKGTGYNGSPSKMQHCDDVGCLMVDGHCKRTIHAEINAILECSPEERKDATIYVTSRPCSECAKVIINSGIVRVVYAQHYEPDYDWFKDAPWIDIIQIDDVKKGP